jgi:H+/Cl- antiporter ClcA
MRITAWLISSGIMTIMNLLALLVLLTVSWTNITRSSRRLRDSWTLQLLVLVVWGLSGLLWVVAAVSLMDRGYIKP